MGEVRFARSERRWRRVVKASPTPEGIAAEAREIESIRDDMMRLRARVRAVGEHLPVFKEALATSVEGCTLVLIALHETLERVETAAETQRELVAYARANPDDVLLEG
jgi:hypothetical protein